MTACRRPASDGFTLVELLVVVAIIATLVGLLLPAVQGARESARRTHCANNLKQIGTALQVYQAAMGTFPPGSVTANQLSWRVFILPQLEQQALHDKFDFGIGGGKFWSGANQEGPNKSVHALNRIPTYHCASATRIFATDKNSTLLNPTRETYNSHYYGVSGPKGIHPRTGQPYPWVDYRGSGNVDFGGYTETGLLYRDSAVNPATARDGLSNTLMAGELAVRGSTPWTAVWDGGGDGGNWVRGGCCDPSTAPPAGTDPVSYWRTKGPSGTAGSKNVDLAINGIPVSPMINDAPFGSLHTAGGATFVRGDGSVSFVGESIDITVYKSLCSRRGEEPDVSY